MKHTGVVFNIQRFSIHDGPGIRTTVFLKGCTMSCFWCHNPEGRCAHPQIQYYPERCIGCAECVDACANKAHLIKNGAHIYIKERCENCGHCIDTCYSGALELVGEKKTADQVMEEILRDYAYYDNLKGGVTLSGGEPVMGGEFAREILKRCRDKKIHTAIETCGNYKWEKLANLLPFIDLVMMDLKHLDSEKHQIATGQSNERIIKNARRLALTNKPIIFRTPIVPSVNDTVEEIGEIAEFIKSLIKLRISNGFPDSPDCKIQYELLPFHKLAADKYRSLGLEYQAQHLELLNKNKIKILRQAAKKSGIQLI